MTERSVPLHCPYCGEENLCPHEATARRLGVPELPRASRSSMSVCCRPYAFRRANDGNIDRGAQRPRRAADARDVAGAELELAPAPRRSSNGLSRRSAPFLRHLVHGRRRPRPPGVPVAPGIDVVFLDTGYHFSRPSEPRDAVGDTIPVNVSPPAELRRRQDERLGRDLWARDPDLCCALRKVDAHRQSQSYDAWATGLRREETRRPGDRAGRGMGRQEEARSRSRRSRAGLRPTSTSMSATTTFWSTPCSSTGSLDRLLAVHTAGRAG